MNQDNNLLTYTLRWHGRAAVEPVYGTGIVAVEIAPRGRGHTPVMDALWAPGLGYEICVTAAPGPAPRKLSDAAKQSIRRKSLKRRLAKDAPLFADALYADAVEKQSDYFG